MSSVIIGKPNIKYLQTFVSGSWTATEGYVRELTNFYTNVSEITNKAEINITVIAELPAGAKLDIQILDKDNNVLDSWTWDNSGNTTPMLGLHSYRTGKTLEYAPFKVKTLNITGTITLSGMLFPRYYKLIKAEKLYAYRGVGITLGAGSTEWASDGVQPVVQTVDNYPYNWYFSLGTNDRVDIPIIFNLHYIKTNGDYTINDTTKNVRLYRTILIWV